MFSISCVHASRVKTQILFLLAIVLMSISCFHRHPGFGFFQVAIGSLLLSGLMGVPAKAQIRKEPPVSLDVCPIQVSGFNTVRLGDVVVVGRQPSARYVVVVPGRSRENLARVRRCIPDAFIAQSRLGSYIHAGAFLDRSAAETVSWLMRSQGLDARVVYFP